MVEKVLFLVEGLVSNSRISRMSNFGDNYGERYPCTKFVVATSAEEAIAHVYDAMEKERKEVAKKAKNIASEIKSLKAHGKHKEAVARESRATGFPGELSSFPLSIPRDREKWKASEVKVPGYLITVALASDAQSPSVRTRRFWSAWRPWKERN